MSEEVEEKKSGGGGKGLIIVLIILVVLLLVGMGVMAYILMTKLGGDHKEEATAEVHAPAGHGEEGGHGDEENPHAVHYSPKFKQYDPPPADAPPVYFSMKPFVVNFKGDGQAKFLAVTLKFMSHYPQLVGEHGDMEHLRPILRNDITELLRKQHYNELNADDGPEKLRKRILEVARKVLEEHGIYPDLLEDVYFERFVMQ